jgi:hypothetical protein
VARVLTPAAQARLEELPGWAQEAPEHKALCQCFANEGERQRERAREIRDGMIPIKANALTLPLWETVLKLTVNPVGVDVSTRRGLVITKLLGAIPDPSGKTWEEQVTAFLGPGWSYEEDNTPDQTIRVKVPFVVGSSDFLQAERILRAKIPAAWELFVESGEDFILDQSEMDVQQFHSTP